MAILSRPRLAVLVSFSGQGGVERMIANLTSAMLDFDIDLDLLLIKKRGPHADALPGDARHIELRSQHSATSVFEVAKYLRKERPTALLAVKHRSILAALRARTLAGTDTPVSGRLGTNVTAALAGGSWLRRAMWYRAMRRFYPRLHRIIAVSEGVAQDIAQVTGVSAPQLCVIRNPVVTPKLLELAAVPLDLPAGLDTNRPIIVGAGRLTRQKDFPTLLTAFSRLTLPTQPQLVILGEGEDRMALEAQAEQMGIAQRTFFPGFQQNPWNWMRMANVFVLSSLWEGSPNSLTEAMALDTPVVSTNCPSGPNELLQGGELAPLLTMGDSDAMAKAISAQLTDPPPSGVLQAAVNAYHAPASAHAYLKAMGLLE